MTAQTTATRRRLIVAEGDGQPITRTAREYAADVAVYVAPGDARPESNEHPRVRLVVTGDGRWLVEQRAGNWSVPTVTAARGHVDRVPSPMPEQRATPPGVELHQVDPARTALVWVFEGEPCTGDVQRFADFLAGAAHAGEDAPRTLYAPTSSGELVPVPFAVDVSPYDSNDWAHASVVVTLADGVTVSGSYRIDGRA